MAKQYYVTIYHTRDNPYVSSWHSSAPHPKTCSRCIAGDLRRTSFRWRSRPPPPAGRTSGRTAPSNRWAIKCSSKWNSNLPSLGKCIFDNRGNLSHFSRKDGVFKIIYIYFFGFFHAYSPWVPFPTLHSMKKAAIWNFNTVDNATLWISKHVNEKKRRKLLFR